jgi:DNA-binding NarL/FixJ family response regulator
MESIVRDGADFVAVLEAMYRPEPDDHRWAHGLFAALAGVVPTAHAHGLGAIAHAPDFTSVALVLGATSGRSPTHVDQLDAIDLPDEFSKAHVDGVKLSVGDLLRATWYPGRAVETHSEFGAALTGDIHRAFHAYRERTGARDGLALWAYPEPGLPTLLWAWFDHEITLSRAELRVMHQIAGHLDSAFRLRYRPDLAVAAVLSPAGRLLDLDDTTVGGAQRDRLSSCVVALDRARLRRRRCEADAVDDWRALVEGRYSVVPRDDSDGKRFYLLVRNPAISEPHARFTKREIDVLRVAARGFTGKGIAYALGLSEASVSTALGSAAAKVGLRSRLALVDVASAMFGSRASGAHAAPLTAAERDVLELLRRGMSNAEIARLRARSARTVANQVASILRKSGVPSRRGLAATIPVDGAE